MNLRQMGSKTSRSQEQHAWLLRCARACSICFQWGWGSLFINRHRILYKFSKNRAATPLFVIGKLMFFHGLQVSTFVLLTSLGFVCVLWGHDAHRKTLLSGVHLPSLGTCHPRGPISKVNCQRNGFLGKSHMAVLCKSGTSAMEMCL